MPPTEPSCPGGEVRKERWLPDEPTRARPWAYEEVLFGSARERERELDAVVEDLRAEHDELLRLYRELDEHLARIASLERRLHDLTPAPGPELDELRPASPKSLPRTGATPGGGDDLRAAHVPRSYSLSRCEGFEVDSPTGPVGYVEGLRFISRIDQPDLLEVRGGRFGRQLLLIPIEQVEDIQVTEERVVVRSAPSETGDLVGDLVERFRRALHFDQAAS